MKHLALFTAFLIPASLSAQKQVDRHIAEPSAWKQVAPGVWSYAFGKVDALHVDACGPAIAGHFHRLWRGSGSCRDYSPSPAVFPPLDVCQVEVYCI